MKRKHYLFGALLLLLCSHADAQVLINELMQSNIDCIMDDRNEYPDSWVELYNPSDSLLSLDEFRIGLSSDPNQAYVLPSNSTIAPHQYRLIYCDKEAVDWHTNFRLESGNGGAVYLFQRTQVVDSVIRIAKQPAPNISYGRATDGDSLWGYQLSPSPGSTNNSGLANNSILGEPVFSVSGRVFTLSSSQRIQLSVPANSPEGTEIRFTTNGSEPTLANSSVYSGTIVISNTTIIRAKLFCTGYLSPRSTTQSYIFLDRQMTLPVVSIVTDGANLYDNQKGIYVTGTYGGGKENYKYDWRRPINFEFFTEPNSASQLNQLCEVRIQGGASRGCALKSLALYANKRFGEKRFNYEFFPDQKPGMRNFKSFLLRNAGNDFDYLYLRDAIIQRSMGQYQDIDWQAWRPTIVYINGVYKGIENIRERSNDDHIYTNYNGLEDIVMMENTWELKEGTWNDWAAFKQFYEQSGHTWAEYQETMDCIEFINVMIMDLFYNNQDWPGNNTVFWKPLQATPQLPARWRIIAKDTDFGLGLYDSPANYQTMTWFYDNGFDSNRSWANTADGTRLYRRALANPDFLREFVDRAAIYIGDFLNFDAVWPLWEQMYNTIKTEYPHHRKLYNEWWPNYTSEMNKAKQWLQMRPQYFLPQLVQKYNLGALKSLAINTTLSDDELDGIHVQFSGVTLSKPTWAGQFYSNQSITLTANTDDTSNPVVGWQITRSSTTGGESVVVQGNSCQFTIRASDSKVVVNAIRAASTDLMEIAADKSSSSQTRKFFDEGQLYIQHDGRLFTITGQEIQ